MTRTARGFPTFFESRAAVWHGQPVVQMAETAMRALLRHLEGDEELPQRIELGKELVVRGSTAAPRPGK
ncbi:DNA-binding LacI/PurR family transcriptional regulator [Arthrobacter sp. 1088]|uniref:hypothetical protein n=1 Tax=Arthrobacter sp. 1088 TaxID=2817768 RepID=UPI0028591339|nr:hypothetical protein [Arthrobacter sp. 1088]MDR6685704.1 DNA-binding LacI/PurR family transcriptional regulator [Arthrobacter sp. 1088]